MKKPDRLILGIQFLYYLTTGIWPLINIESFMDVTGYKTDQWLVKTVGILISCISFTMLVALVKRRISDEVLTLIGTTCTGLIIVDVYFSLNNIISKIYLVDAFVELLFLIYWLNYLYNPSFKKFSEQPDKHR